MDGSEFIRALRTRTPDRSGHVAALALTAFARLDVALARASGYDGHLSKPVNPRELAGAIIELRRRRGYVETRRGLRLGGRLDARTPLPRTQRAPRPPASDRLSVFPRPRRLSHHGDDIRRFSFGGARLAPLPRAYQAESRRPDRLHRDRWDVLASPGAPPIEALVWGNLGIALASACAATINHVLDRRIDEQMARTRARPLPTGQLNEKQALAFAAVLGVAAMAILAFLVNLLTAALTFASLIGYAVVYTVWLKRATSQNIVIGGAAGAAPPVLGWAAVTNSVDPNALLLFLIIFVWTPPHFWALAIARRDEYARAGIPMLPVTHGVEHTRLHVLLYTLLLVARYTPAVSNANERLAVSRRRTGAQRGLRLLRAGDEDHGTQRASYARVPLLDHLPDVAFRGAPRRPLPADDPGPFFLTLLTPRKGLAAAARAAVFRCSGGRRAAGMADLRLARGGVAAAAGSLSGLSCASGSAFTGSKDSVGCGAGARECCVRSR